MILALATSGLTLRPDVVNFDYRETFRSTCESVGFCNTSLDTVSQQLAVVSSYVPWVRLNFVNSVYLPQAMTTPQRLELLSSNKHNFIVGLLYDFSFQEELAWARKHNFFHLSPLTLCALTSQFNAEFLSSLPPDQFDYICHTSLENHFRQWLEKEKHQRKTEEVIQGNAPRDVINSWLVIHFPRDSPHTVLIFVASVMLALVFLYFTLKFICKCSCCCCWPCK